MLLVANKVDLVHLRKVTEESGRELAHKLGIPYIETSAKDPPLNVDAAFHEVGYYLISQEVSYCIKYLTFFKYKIFSKSNFLQYYVDMVSKLFVGDILI